MVATEAALSPIAIPFLLAALCSLCLLILNSWPVFAFRSQISTRRIWGFNTKDAFGDGGSLTRNTPDLSILGNQRSTPINNPVGRAFIALGPHTKRFAINLLFRRVQPVESRIYAFSRNFFAVIAMGILVFRAVTALQKAEDEIGTRMTSKSCYELVPSYYNISILMERVTYDSRWNSSAPRGTAPIEDVDITVNVTRTGSRRGQAPSVAAKQCTIQWFQDYESREYVGYYERQNRRAELYACPERWRHSAYSYLRQGWGSDILAYDIEVRPRTPGEVLPGQTPQVWLLDSREILSNISSILDFEIREYNPPWELLPGSHIDAEAKLITRRLISSSFIKDTIFNFEPNYRLVSLFPIVESSVLPLNFSNTNTTSATITASLTPGLINFRTQASVRNRDSHVCAFIDDYRSGSVLDIIGSVGGLFALLQAVHLLLFGRPLFWGLTGKSPSLVTSKQILTIYIGAKLITPFGLLGNCSSKGFKRRLRDEYHTTSAEDGSDTIHIVKFLRDFVIEFGPADLEPECQPSQRPLSLEVVVDGPGSQVPLMPLNSDATLVHRREDNFDDHGTRNSDRVNGAAQV